MNRFRSAIRLVCLLAAPFVLYQFFFYFARKPLNDELIEAVKKDDLTQVTSLLNRGADVNSRDSTRFLSCTDPNPQRTLRTPLILSTFRFREGVVFRHNLKMMEMLLQNGADPNLSDSSDMTALHFISSQGDLAAAQLLIDRGANVNASDYSGDTPLTEAAYRSHLAIVKLLLAHGADVNARNSFGSSVLACAAMHSNTNIMKLLLERGVDVDSRDKIGSTPLHRTVEMGNPRAMHLLLQAGANPNLQNNADETPLMHLSTYDLRFASDPNRAQTAARRALMVKLLQQAGATQ